MSSANQDYSTPDPGLVRRLRELGTPDNEIPAQAARIMHEVDAALAARPGTERVTVHTCAYTVDGADPTPTNPACGAPASVRAPLVDYSEWYCTTHADPTRVGICGACDHGKDEHAFFPNDQPAPLCIARTHRYGDTDSQCECEGYES